MKKSILALVALIWSFGSFAQDDCFKKLEDAFTKRGSYTIADEMHRNVIISFFTPEGTECVSGKVRV